MVGEAIMTTRTRIVAAFRSGVAAGFIAVSLASFGTSPAHALQKKTSLECSDDWVECQEYCDKFEKPVGGPNHKTCMQACQYTYDKCRDVSGAGPTRIDSTLYVPGTSPGLFDSGGASQPLFQSQPTQKAQ
jgi:hypothetical protein